MGSLQSGTAPGRLEQNWSGPVYRRDAAAREPVPMRPWAAIARLSGLDGAPGVAGQVRTRPSAVRITRSTYLEPVCFCVLKST